ncbi:putative regulatory protein [Dinoroseobacter shibae DFL 12 = DSM 16493]|jgi:AcrR family transcriptional regulator|uniref:Putative regulatory protein n=1 Tax=Dinoroseobacter shibae (strain DSM 16493 / NCIMB 14021 / DFL 12) TaxID=398580 RepID=A8LNA3_DINSH|nr:TetR/AcrR family transcriptional regulator [Dinoroseobacter shibae]ABV93616.1 putative regulatory protein [Dinoroseobacter shibae DFL 12 = DSM 16493]URF45068.1 TetR/AcrR family transcriptional regulator [Dinoroseobacter shibae]URF49372.1 TetR/AcrR family transcriptional regulator [Dinoroseobacter shibae]
MASPHPPGRPREFDPDEMLDRILGLFWENGYEGTGLSDITRATGLGKASLYAAFGNKHQIYLRALARYEQTVVSPGAAALRAPDTPPRDRIARFLSAPVEAVVQAGDHRGCFLCNAVSDRAALDPETDRMVQRGYGILRRALAATLREADPDTPDPALAARAEMLLSLYAGLRVRARAGDGAAVLAASRDAALALLCP